MSVKRPPGPRDRVFGLSQLRPLAQDPLGYYRDLQRSYGDTVYTRLGPYHDYTVFHPAQIHEVLVEKARAFVRWPRVAAILRQWNGDSVLITEGDTWLRYRRLIQPAFQQQRFTRYAEDVTAATSAALDTLARHTGPVEFEAAMTDLTTAIICRSMFGTDLGEQRDAVRQAVHTLSAVAVREMSSLVSPPDWLPLPSVTEKRRAMALVDETVRRFIRERRASGEDRGDLLSMLLLAVDQEGDGAGLTDQQARDQCVTIFLAGHDTSAAALTFVGWALAAHPELAERTAREIDAVLGGRPPTYADLPRLGSVERIVKEALRRYPPAVALIARQAAQDVEIGGWLVPKGAIVHVVTYVTQHDPRWFPEPERFDPDRFLPEREAQMPTGAYLPFGLGGRVCIGRFFAMMELTLAATMLLQRFRLAPAPGQTEPRLEIGMSVRPVGGLHMTLTPRQASA